MGFIELGKVEMKYLIFMLFLGFLCQTGQSQEKVSFVPVTFKAEYGFLAVLNHRIQFSKGGTYLDYVKDAGQENLYEHKRFTADFRLADDDRIIFVYQPIDLITEKTLETDLVVDNELFESGTPMAFRYSFPYYRSSYLWSINSNPHHKLWLGLGMQIRNASIEFTKIDGSKKVSKRNIGPVPLFAMRYHWQIAPAIHLKYEAEGNYANTKFINGDDESKVEGAIFDTALDLSVDASEKITALGSVRYVSGGARGTSDEVESRQGDGYSSNWIDLLAVSMGINYVL